MNYKISLIDTHAAGDVGRVIFSGINCLPGDTVRKQMEYLQGNADGLRKTLLTEPYGIQEMSINLVIPAKNKAASAGYIIMVAMGYPLYSGSNTMCTATALIENGLVPKIEGYSKFKLEAPAGLVDIEAFVKNGVVESITCEGPPSYIYSYKQKIVVEGLGEIEYSIAYSGGFYALIEASDFNLNLTLNEEKKLKQIAYRVIEAIRNKENFKHYSLGDVGLIPFLVFMGKVRKDSEGIYTSRTSTYVHPNVICRSTTGTGTSARLAFLHYDGSLKVGDKLKTVSIRETTFIGTIDSVKAISGFSMVTNRITGKSYIIGKSEIIINCDDPMADCSDLHAIMSDEVN